MGIFDVLFQRILRCESFITQFACEVITIFVSHVPTLVMRFGSFNALKVCNAKNLLFQSSLFILMAYINKHKCCLYSFDMVFFIEFFPPLNSFCTNNSINELKGFLNNSWCGMILQKYDKGQLISKCLFWYLQFFKKRTKKFNLSTVPSRFKKDFGSGQKVS